MPTTRQRSQPTSSSSPSGVGRVVGHRVRARRDRRAAQAALVVGDDVEALAERRDHDRAGGERRPRPVEEEQRAALAAALVVDVDPVHGRRWASAHPLRRVGREDLRLGAELLRLPGSAEPGQLVGAPRAGRRAPRRGPCGSSSSVSARRSTSAAYEPVGHCGDRSRAGARPPRRWRAPPARCGSPRSGCGRAPSSPPAGPPGGGCARPPPRVQRISGHRGSLSTLGGSACDGDARLQG